MYSRYFRQGEASDVLRDEDYREPSDSYEICWKLCEWCLHKVVTGNTKEWFKILRLQCPRIWNILIPYSRRWFCFSRFSNSPLREYGRNKRSCIPSWNVSVGWRNILSPFVDWELWRTYGRSLRSPCSHASTESRPYAESDKPRYRRNNVGQQSWRRIAEWGCSIHPHSQWTTRGQDNNDSWRSKISRSL